MSKEPTSVPTAKPGAAAATTTTAAAADMPELESLDAASKHESSLSSSGENNNLNRALDNLDSVLNDFPPASAASQSENPSKFEPEMSESTAFDGKKSSKSEDDDNNNKTNSTEALDDLTRQLMEALDTNEVVGWKESVDQVPSSTGNSGTPHSPFGKCQFGYKKVTSDV